MGSDFQSNVPRPGVCRENRGQETQGSRFVSTRLNLQTNPQFVALYNGDNHVGLQNRVRELEIE